MRLIGRALRGVRAGESKIAWNHPETSSPACIVLSSPAFLDGESIPVAHAGKGLGDDISPPLVWSNLPPETAELVLIVEDPDAPLPAPSVHLIATGVPPHPNRLPAGALNATARAEGLQLHHGRLGRKGYFGPMPPPGHGSHRYVFQLFALGRPLQASETLNRKTLLQVMEGKVVARGRLTGLFERR
jgi:Raf kinase inhibitor-like YbhB/YbcL family protein